DRACHSSSPPLHTRLISARTPAHTRASSGSASRSRSAADSSAEADACEEACVEEGEGDNAVEPPPIVTIAAIALKCEISLRLEAARPYTSGLFGTSVSSFERSPLVEPPIPQLDA